MEGITLIKDPVEVLESISMNRGMIWEKISEFQSQIKSIEGALNHTAGTPQSEEMQSTLPLKQKLENGLYTREIFMPKGQLVISFIHKQNHPSFFLSGEMSVLNDKGEVKRIKAPMAIETEAGTQRVAVMHEDCVWVCVYRTDAKTFEEAELEIYTDNYKELPLELIKIEKNKEICQEQYQQ